MFWSLEANNFIVFAVQVPGKRKREVQQDKRSILVSDG